MAAGSTYTPIATTTLGTAQTGFTFSSIPSTYTDLVIVISGSAGAGNSDVTINFNSDSGTNMSSTLLYGAGSGTAASTRRTSLVSSELDWTGIGTGIGNIIINVMNYSNTTTNKTVISKVNFAAVGTNATVSLWRSTATITSVTITATSQNWTVGSIFTLYGIAAA